MPPSMPYSTKSFHQLFQIRQLPVVKLPARFCPTGQKMVSILFQLRENPSQVSWKLKKKVKGKSWAQLASGSYSAKDANKVILWESCITQPFGFGVKLFFDIEVSGGGGLNSQDSVGFVAVYYEETTPAGQDMVLQCEGLNIDDAGFCMWPAK